jgi:hypothetical protein
VPRTELVVIADYHHYYLCVPNQQFDQANVDLTHDGVIAPFGTGVKIGTGIQWGPVEVSVTIRQSPPPQEMPAGVAAACDVSVPSGEVALLNWETEIQIVLNVDVPGLYRMVIEVSGRDEAAVPNGPPERHVITLYRALSAGPRWRSTAIDDAGSGLQVLSDI